MIPDTMGTAQWMFGEAVQPIQKRETTYSGPPTHANGRRRYSSISDHFAPLAFALARNESYQRNIPHAMKAPTPTGFCCQNRSDAGCIEL